MTLLALGSTLISYWVRFSSLLGQVIEDAGWESNIRDQPFLPQSLPSKVLGSPFLSLICRPYILQVADAAFFSN